MFEHFYTSCNTLNYLTDTVAQSQQAQLATDKYTDFCCFFFQASAVNSTEQSTERCRTFWLLGRLQCVGWFHFLYLLYDVLSSWSQAILCKDIFEMLRAVNSGVLLCFISLASLSV